MQPENSRLSICSSQFWKRNCADQDRTVTDPRALSRTIARRVGHAARNQCALSSRWSRRRRARALCGFEGCRGCFWARSTAAEPN